MSGLHRNAIACRRGQNTHYISRTIKMNSFLLAIAVPVCLLLVMVQSYSEPDCSEPCDQTYCPKTSSCKCGTYLDYCGCCSFCLGCPGEECNLVGHQRCANGTTCKAREGADALERINGPGTCR